MIGFRRTNISRQPIYGERIAGKVGYVERQDGREYFCDLSGKRTARVLRWKPQQAPQPQTGLCGGTIVRPDIV